MSVLIKALTEKQGYPHLEAHEVECYLAQQQTPTVLFFSGEPLKVPESNDVAVILPELIKHFNGRVSAAVVTASDAKLKARFGFSRWPALVFMHGNGHLGTISQIQNWSDYVAEIESILNATPAPLPGFPLPVVTENSAGACHGQK